MVNLVVFFPKWCMIEVEKAHKSGKWFLKVLD